MKNLAEIADVTLDQARLIGESTAAKLASNLRLQQNISHQLNYNKNALPHNFQLEQSYFPVESYSHYESRIDDFFKQCTAEYPDQLLLIQQVPNSSCEPYHSIFWKMVNKYNYQPYKQNFSHKSLVLCPSNKTENYKIAESKNYSNNDVYKEFRAAKIQYGNSCFEITYVSVHIKMPSWGPRGKFKYNNIVKSLT